MPGRNGRSYGVVEEADEFSIGVRRVGSEVVLEDDRDVELAGGELAQGGATIDQVVLDRQFGVTRRKQPADLGGQIDERGNERAQEDLAWS
jgi:hypothetical protein